MFTINNTKVYFKYTNLTPEQVETLWGVRLPSRIKRKSKLSLRSTLCLLEDVKTKDAEGAGIAVCSPSDNFEKDRGRKVALAEALKDRPKEERTKFWDAYFKALES